VKLDPLRWNDGLGIASHDHCNDAGRKGMVGHYGSDGSSPFQRIDRYGEAAGYQAENISYGPNTGTEIVMGLFIDDGVPDRGHRTNMLNSNFGQTGIAFCRHTSKFNFMTEITYTGRFTPNEKA